MSQASLTPVFKTVPELAETLRLSQQAIYKHISEGLVKTIRVGREHRIPSEEFERILREGIVRPTPNPEVA